jgi:hypothetical protein
MDIRPIDLPDLKADLITYLASSKAEWFFHDRARGTVFSGFDPRHLQACEVGALASAEMYHLSQQMLDLATAAADSLPPFELAPEDLPSRAGFAFLGSGAAQLHPKVGEAAAVLWSSLASWDKTTANQVIFTFYADTELVVQHVVAEGRATRKQATEHRVAAGRLSPMALEAVVPFGSSHSPDRHGLEPMLRVVRAAWLLMQQPLARTTEAEPNRATQKRLRRAGHEPKPVRVIELRRPAHSGSGDSSREFHHQWIVRGHWRQQWYPAREVHRPVWIAPHIKGPEGAPLIGGEKVYAWKR